MFELKYKSQEPKPSSLLQTVKTKIELSLDNDNAPSFKLEFKLVKGLAKDQTESFLSE